MHTRSEGGLRVLLVVGVAAFFLVALQAAGYAASWTVMVYLDADNNLEGAGIEDINEMEMAPSSPQVNVLVQIDRIPGYDTSNGNWPDTRRYRITHDTDPILIRSQQVSSFLGELNMGDPQTLVDFAEWGIANYPADHYLLILWDHGSGWKKTPVVKPHKGVAWDETDDDYLTTAETASALASIRTFLDRKLDIVACDACLMQMAELAYEFRGSAGYYVASEETIPWDGFPYDDWLTVLAGSLAMSAGELSAVLVDTYVASYNGGSQGTDYVTLSAVDLSRIGEVAGCVDDLGVALGNAMASCCQHIITYVTGAQCYADFEYRDLYHLGQLMEEHIPDDGVVAAAGAVKSAVQSAVIANGSVGSGLADSHGLSIYYPYPDPYSTGYAALSFAVDTGWDEYISGEPPCSGILPDSYEPDDSPGQASLISSGVPETDHWFHVEGDQDWARFAGEAGRWYQIETENLGNWCDTLLYLYDTDGSSLITWDDDSGSEEFASLVDWLCPSPGTYYVRVEHFWPDYMGLQTDYDLHLTEHRFADVLPDYWAFSYIETCAEAGIVGGYADGSYRPDAEVTRDQMAVYISRALYGGDEYVPSAPAVATFSDVPTDQWAFKYVECAASSHLVGGYDDGTYRPGNQVDRGQMAVFVARAMVTPPGDEGLASYTPPETPTFSDVPLDFWSYRYVEYIAQEGVTTGYDDGTYRPAVVVTRDQMAVYVQRAFGLAM